MTAFNIVRCRVKPGHEEHFIAEGRLKCVVSGVAL
jgi:hypothetical protein